MSESASEDVEQEPRSVSVSSEQGYVVLGDSESDESGLILSPTEAETLAFELLRSTTDALAHRAVLRYRESVEAELAELAAEEQEAEGEVSEE